MLNIETRTRVLKDVLVGDESELDNICRIDVQDIRFKTFSIVINCSLKRCVVSLKHILNFF